MPWPFHAAPEPPVLPPTTPPASPGRWCDWCDATYDGAVCPCCSGQVGTCAHTPLGEGPRALVWGPPAAPAPALPVPPADPTAWARDCAAVAAHLHARLPPGPVRDEALRHLHIVDALGRSASAAPPEAP